MIVLVTGASGFIGSHVCLSLLQAGHEIVALDNLCNSSVESLVRVGRLFSRNIPFIKQDARDGEGLRRLFSDYRIDAVIHLAGLKSVRESVIEPGKYYDNNVVGTLRLLEAMYRAKVERIVFSSSATVYDTGRPSPLPEDTLLSPSNPYGRSKHMAEQIISDMCHSHAGWKAILLRYFNPVGAHESGEIGEAPSGIPNNLMPYLAQVAGGRIAKLQVFGNDYPTHDGTGVRDYVHVMDLAEGHVAALDALEKITEPSIAINLGAGRGYSVLDMVHAFEQASGTAIPLVFTSRRPGDAPAYFADVRFAENFLGWKARREIEMMCRDTWRWQKAYPDGYA